MRRVSDVRGHAPAWVLPADWAVDAKVKVIVIFKIQPDLLYSWLNPLRADGLHRGSFTSEKLPDRL